MKTFSLPVVWLSLVSWAQASETIQFNRDIRPILSNHCFQCHGPDEKKRDGDRRLDTFDGATEDVDGTRAIVPGKPEESELWKRIISHDRDEVMPPPKSKKPPLTAEQLAKVKAWIEQGAKYEGHWAFLPVAKPAPPEVSDERSVKNEIDRFIRARLESEGIRPSPEADRATLIRRLSLDLTGLLPTSEEVHAFTEDRRPDAYELLVDRLLASPHYGERWGRHWLDQARYADSNGYTVDNERAMWPYRDWVIEALNRDLPFNEFTIEQLAGDLLPKPTKSQLVATAFHRNTLINEEGGTDKEQFRNEAVVDRVNTTGAVWLGLTVGCAQCHTHKFDPISHREYFQLFAFFNQSSDVNNKGEVLPVARGEMFGHSVLPTEAEQEARQVEWEKRELAKAPAQTRAAKPVPWEAAQYLEYDTASGAGFRLLEDNSLLADGRGAFNDTYRVVTQTKLKKVAALRLRVLTHESLPKQGPGMAKNGNFVLTEVEVNVGGKPLALAGAFADHQQPKYGAQEAADGNTSTGWAINVGPDSKGRMNANHELIVLLKEPLEVGEQTIEVKLRHDLNESYLVGRFAIDFSEQKPSPGAAPAEGLLATLLVPPAKRSGAQQKQARQAFLAAEKQAQIAKGDLVELMVMKEATEARETFIHLRGDFLRPDAKTGPLQPGVLAAVQTAYGEAQPPMHNRLDLARWLVDPKNPLTSRVTVNRVWMHYFGRGLVETEEDFGTQGTPPTHPELLDWLASRFVQDGWSMKKLHRLIVSSATYRQSSKARPDLQEKDPRNLLLARQERLRIEAEIVRDTALSASGLLDTTIGGPSVKPPQAEGVYAFTQNKKKWVADTGGARYRRALYTQFYRSAPHPLFTTFDAPDFQTVCTRRVRSNTPLQALTVANDPAFLEFAQGLAARVLRQDGESDEAWLRRAFAICLSREPSEKEFYTLQGFVRRQLESFREEPEAAKALLTPDLLKLERPSEKLAAAVAVARVLFNTDNFITRE